MRIARQQTAGAAIIAAFLACVGQARGNEIFELPTPNPYTNNSYSFGEIFTVGAQNLTVTALGAYDDNGNGFVTPGGIPVGLYRESDAALLASTNVISTDPLVGNFRFGSVAPLTLLSGVQYRVVAVSEIDNYNLGPPFTVDPLVTANGYAYGFGTTLLFSNAFTGSDTLFMPNFLAAPTVPEPASLVLLGLGAAGLFLGARRRRPSKIT